jgi:hypothetical protein
MMPEPAVLNKTDGTDGKFRLYIFYGKSIV